MTSRKPAFVRWAEEAEAKQVCEWAELDHASNPPEANTERSRVSDDRPSFLRLLRELFGAQITQIERDG